MLNIFLISIHDFKIIKVTSEKIEFRAKEKMLIRSSNLNPESGFPQLNCGFNLQ